MLRCGADLYADQFFSVANVCANAVCGGEEVAAAAAMMAGGGDGPRASSVFASQLQRRGRNTLSSGRK